MEMEMDIKKPNCAGIDVGSKSHFVAMGPGLEDVRELGVYGDELKEICLWLKSLKVPLWLLRA